MDNQRLIEIQQYLLILVPPEYPSKFLHRYTAHLSHYHHYKTEKFLVIKGHAQFGFRHILTEETYELFTSGEQPCIVETIPGWSHDITNVGEEEMIVMLWANEIFDRDRPDTITSKV